MKTEVEEISPVKKKIVVEVDAEEVGKKLNEAYRTLGKQAKIPGFRKGKIPRKILEQYFGSQVLEDVTKNLVNETLPGAVEEADIIPLSMPVIENDSLKQGEVFKYAAIMEVKPEFEIKDYMGVEVEKEIIKVDEDSVSKQIEELLQAHGNLNPMEEDRGIKEDDHVVIEYQGFDGDQPIDEVKSENFMIRIGKSDFHPEIEKALIGLNKDDSTEVAVAYSEDHYNTKLAGLNINFKIKIIDVKTMDLPEMNDEFVEGLGIDIKTVDELESRIREDLTKREETRIDMDVKRRLMKKIADEVEFDLPESLVNSEIDRAVNNIKQDFMRSGSDIEKAGLSEAKLREDFRGPSEKRVKDMLILAEISTLENLTVEDKDLEQGFKDAGESMGQPAEVIQKYYEANQLMDTFKDQLLREKTLNSLVSGAKVNEVEADQITKDEN